MRWFRPLAFAFGGVFAAFAIALSTGAGWSSPSAPDGAVIAATSGRSAGATVAARPSAPADPAVQREAVVKRCMGDAGFEYHPIDWARVNAQIADARAQLDLTEDSLLTRHGYGLTDGATRSLPAVQIDDPNTKVTLDFTDAQKRAYSQARSNCTGFARQAVPDAASNGAPGADSAAITAARRAAQADPRVVAATEDWARCMGDRGYTFVDRRSAVAEVKARVDALAAAFGSTDLSRLAKDPAAAPILAGELDATRAFELGVAASDLTCKGNLEATAQAVELEYVAGLAGGDESVSREVLGQERPVDR